jgi:hypothetical protein
MAVIPAAQEAGNRRISVQSQSRQIVLKILSQKTLSQKIGLVEWLKVKALSSAKKKKKRNKTKIYK